MRCSTGIGVLLAALVWTAAAPADIGPRPAAQVIVRGDIGKLGPARIAVGRVSCSIPARLAATAARFVIGDPVKMTCLNGSLRALKYAPLPASPSVGVPSRATGPPTRTAVGGASQGSVWSMWFVTPGSTSSPAAKTTAAGTLTDISADGITVGGLSCRMQPAFYTALSPVAHVGDRVTIACASDTGQLSSLSSTR